MILCIMCCIEVRWMQHVREADSWRIGKECRLTRLSIAALTLASGLLMGGCAPQLLLDERLRENTSGVVGVSAR
jgi:hypothetical protein